MTNYIDFSEDDADPRPALCAGPDCYNTVSPHSLLCEACKAPDTCPECGPGAPGYIEIPCGDVFTQPERVPCPVCQGVAL